VRESAGCRVAAAQLGRQIGQTNPLKTIAELIDGLDAKPRTALRR